MLSADLSVRDYLEKSGTLGIHCVSKFKMKHASMKRLSLYFRLGGMVLIMIFGI